MAANIAHIVAQLKADVGHFLSSEHILETCAQANHQFRERTLGPVLTVHAFLIQILHGNTACSHLPHLLGKSFTAAAYCEARARLPLAVFESLYEQVGSALRNHRRPQRWHGHRTWFIDGSSFSMPDTPALQDAFGQPGGQAKGCGFPVAHLLVLFQAETGFLQRVIPSPLRTHDMANAADLHEELRPRDVLVADRGFASYAHLALILQRKLHAVFRCHQKQIVNFRPGRKHRTSSRDPKGLPTSRWLKKLGKNDQLVEYRKPEEKPEWMSEEAYAALPETLVVREIRYTISVPGCRTKTVTLVTTLLDAEAYPAAAIAALYGRRWGIEINLRHLKTTMAMEVLHCQSVEGVLKELAMFALVYNLVRLVMLKASRRQKVPVDRISFVDAMRWLQSAKPGQPLGDLEVLPIRENRYEPRVRKRRPKEYDLMNRPRRVLRKRLARKGVRA